MTYTLTLTPYHAAQLAACCLHAGLDLANIFPARLTRHSEPAAQPTTPAPEPAADLEAQVAALWTPLPTPVCPSLRGPGEAIPDPGTIDWDDPETYR